MKKDLIFNAMKLAAALLCSAVLFSSCNKLENLGTGEIRFTIASGSSSDTKTIYGDDVTAGGKNYQFIDWVTGDQVRIMCDKTEPTTADYTVTKVCHEGIMCLGTVSSDSPLLWENEETEQHTFYAVYPSPATAGAVCTIEGNLITGNIPENQSSYFFTESGQVITSGEVIHSSVTPATSYPSMLNQYMVAKTEAEAKASSVVLDFEPMATALEFTLTNGLANRLIINSIELSSENYALNGNFTIDMDVVGVNGRHKCTTTATAADNGHVMLSVPQFFIFDPETKCSFTIFLNPGNGGESGINDLRLTINGKNNMTQQEFTRTALLMKETAGDIAFPTHKKTRIKGVVVLEAIEWDIEGTIFVTPWTNGVSQNVPLP